MGRGAKGRPKGVPGIHNPLARAMLSASAVCPARVVATLRSKAARPRRQLPTRATGGAGGPSEQATIPERLGADAQYSKLNELLVQSQLVSRLSDGALLKL